MSSTHQMPAAVDTDTQIRQYTLKQIIATWAAAALPMGALAWMGAPLLARGLDGPGALTRALILVLTLGLVWQFVMVVVLVYREQQSFRWSVVKDALWLHAPTSPRSGRHGGRVWLILIPLILLFGMEEILPDLLPAKDSYSLGVFAESDAGVAFFSDNWLWLGIVTTLLIFNTVLGEELLFRGLLLPRMNGVFGRWDGLANGVLFAAYHLHMPWAMPWIPIDAVALAYPSKWYRSALIGIAVHSVQSIVIFVAVLALVLR